MQTIPPYAAQAGHSMGGSIHPSYYPTQSQYNPNGYAPQNMGRQANYNPNYQAYHNEWNNASNVPYHGYSHGPQSQRQSVQYINPAYQYNYDHQHLPQTDARYHERVEYYDLPSQYRNTTGRLPQQYQQQYAQQNPQQLAHQYAQQHQQHSQQNPQQLAHQFAQQLPHNPQQLAHQFAQQLPHNPQQKPKVPLLKEIIYEQQQLNIPESVKNVQYIPNLNRYMDYVQQRVKIPIQKYFTDYYEVQHVTDFVPREYEESVIEMVPEEIVRYKLQYVPVQRKIVHMPKTQIYDENGLFKGVGNLADRQIGHAVIGLQNQAENKKSREISRTIYDQVNSQIRALDESLVDRIGKDTQNQARTQAAINNAIYEGIKGEMGSPSLPKSQINRAIYQGLQGNLNPSAMHDGMASQQRITQAIYHNIGGHSRLPQNQLINAQLYASLSRVSSNQRSRASRTKTNFVTSDGYFPNYDDQMQNLRGSF